MGRPLPGVPVVLVDPLTGERSAAPAPRARSASTCGPLGRPLPLMTGYQGDPERNAEAMAGGCYHTGDVATRDADGYITYVGRTDDVFKASDYKISPFELESVLIEHPAVAEAAVVPAPDPVRLAVPKAYVALAPGYEPTEETALRDPAATPASTSRRTSGCGGSSSSSCPRRSPARSAGSSCAPARVSSPSRRARRTSGATTSSRSCAAPDPAHRHPLRMLTRLIVTP